MSILRHRLRIVLGLKLLIALGTNGTVRAKPMWSSLRLNGPPTETTDKKKQGAPCLFVFLIKKFMYAVICG